MNKLHRVVEISQKYGFYTLLSKSIDYAKPRSERWFWTKYYNTKATILGSHIVNINGVLIDLNDSVFSPAMKRKLRIKDYEGAETNLIRTHIHTDYPTIDLGAGVGYTTCLIDRKTNDRVVGVEANKRLIPAIKRTRDLNKCDFEICYAAYDSQKETVEFQVAEDFWSSSQYKREDRKQTKMSVPAISLNRILKKYDLEQPTQLVVDIEGGEHSLITDEKNVLKDNISLIILEYHSFTDHNFSYHDKILREIGFKYSDSQGNVHVYENETM